jgi:predicted MFS family arabinose efflux permease
VRPIGDATRVALAGAAMVGVTFGMARYGLGLTAPDVRGALGLGSAALGLIAAGSYAAYLAATAAAPALIARRGPRAAVLGAGMLAAVGMLVVAAAPGPAVLTVGILVAGASSGLAFPPFADLVAARVAPRRRGRALAVISSGTGLGVAVAAPVALVAAGAWRTAWMVYAALALGATAWAARALPRGKLQGARAPADRLTWSWLLCPRSGPLLVGALFVGLGSSVYWTFAVDIAVGEGALSPQGGRALFIAVGLASVLGGLGGELARVAGLRAGLLSSALLLAGALGALAVAPGTGTVAVVAGVAFGSAYNLVIALQVLWSAEVFAERPSIGLAATMFALSSGLLAGPAIGGGLIAAAGPPTAFGAATGAVLVGALSALRLPSR